MPNDNVLTDEYWIFRDGAADEGLEIYGPVENGVRICIAALPWGKLSEASGRKIVDAHNAALKRALAAHPVQPEPRGAAQVPCPICGGEAVDHLDVLERVTIAPEPRAEVTDYQIADMFERVTGYSIENGRAALNDADILGFARELLEAARTGASS